MWYSCSTDASSKKHKQLNLEFSETVECFYASLFPTETKYSAYFIAVVAANQRWLIKSALHSKPTETPHDVSPTEMQTKWAYVEEFTLLCLAQSDLLTWFSCLWTSGRCTLKGFLCSVPLPTRSWKYILKNFIFLTMSCFNILRLFTTILWHC